MNDRDRTEGLPIIQYWHSEELPVEIAELTATFRDLNPGLRHHVYNEAEADRFIAAHFTARELAAFRACAVPAMQADYFRYCAVLALGGVYADVGFACRWPLQSLIAGADEAILFRQPPQVINGFFLARAPDHPFLRLTLDVATANIEERVSKSVSKVTGPWIFTGLAAIRDAGSFETVRKLVTGREAARWVACARAAIGEYERLERALERVRIEPIELANESITRPATPRQYKQSGTSWVGWHRRKGTIFR